MCRRVAVTANAPQKPRETDWEVGTAGCPTKEERAAHDRASIALPPQFCHHFVHLTLHTFNPSGIKRISFKIEIPRGVANGYKCFISLRRGNTLKKVCQTKSKEERRRRNKSYRVDETILFSVI